MPTTTIADIRKKFPQYNDLSDAELADRMHRKFYSDIPREEFDKRIGMGAEKGFLRKADDFVRGAADMLTFGLADEISAGLGSLTGIGGEHGNYDANLAAQRQRDQEGGGARLAGQIAGGVGGAAGLARSGLSLGANAIQAGKSLPAVAGASAVEGGILSGLHGFGSGEGGLKDRAVNAGISGAVGGGIGLAAPYAVAGISSAARRAVTPLNVSPERMAAAQTLRKEGVPLTAGQLSGSRGLRYAEAELGGTKAANLMDQQREAFTSAVLKRAGIRASKATPEVMDSAFRSVGKQFDNLAAKNTLIPDQQMLIGLRDVFREYGQIVPESMRAPIVKNIVNDIVRATQKGKLSGEAYQNLTSRLAKAARGASNPDLKHTLYGMREVIDDAMERSIAANNPANVGAWRQAREQYRNLLAIEQSASRAGEQAAEGLISPANIRNAAVKQGRRAYVRGKGDFADLSRSGSMLLTPLPDSGTAGRTAAKNLGAIGPMLSGAVIGGGAGAYQSGDMTGALAGAAVGAAAPRIAGRALMSPLVQKYLANQLMTKDLPREVRAAINALLVSQGAGAAGRLAAP